MCKRITAIFIALVMLFCVTVTTHAVGEDELTITGSDRFQYGYCNTLPSGNPQGYVTVTSPDGQSSVNLWVGTVTETDWPTPYTTGISIRSFVWRKTVELNGPASKYNIEIPRTIEDLPVQRVCLDGVNLTIGDVFLPDTVTEVITTYGSNRLHSYSVDEHNPYLTAIDGVLFTKDGLLVSYPVGKMDSTYIVPEFVDTLNYYAFADNPSLQQVTFTGIAVADEAFRGCTALQTVLFGDNLQFLCNNIFEGCNRLRTVHFPVKIECYIAPFLMEPALTKNVTVCAHELSEDVQYITNGMNFAFRQCGEEHNFPAYPMVDTPTNPPVIPPISTPGGVSAGTVTVHSHDALVQIPITLSQNPGMIAMTLKIQYDRDALSLVGVENGGVFPDTALTTSGTMNTYPFTLMWEDSLANCNNKQNGTLAVLTFRVNENFTGNQTEILVLCEPGTCFNVNLSTVQLHTGNGKIHIVACHTGDIKADGQINMLDAILLRRYIAGWDVSICETAADIDHDGTITLKDLAILMRYLAGGWGVELQ